jgi:hypothetical protein
MEKYKFFQDLLSEKYITQEQRNRLVALISREMKSIEKGAVENGADVTRTFDKLEAYTDSKSVVLKRKSDDLPKYFDPFFLHDYLFRFNQNKILKSACHKMDINELENVLDYCSTDFYDFQVHRHKLLEAFEKHDKGKAPANMKSLIRSYLTGKNYRGKDSFWTENEIKVNWMYPELELWCGNNPKIPPTPDDGLMEKIENRGFKFSSPIFIKESNEFISTFSDLLIYFKKQFHIRSDNSLKKIIEECNSVSFWKDRLIFEIDDNFPKNIEFFTDVDKLKQAYRRLLELIWEQCELNSAPNKVTLMLRESVESIEFSIIHNNFNYGKSLNNTLERLGNSYRNLIKRQVNGLCNFYLKADFENDGPYQIGIWDRHGLWDVEKPLPIKLDQAVGGVEHIFEFRKTRKKIL